ncbi:MAG: GxxExxY protein [Anaerolineales bacterium]
MMKEIEQINELTQEIIVCAIDVHQTLGQGLPESAYIISLSAGLAERGIKIEEQKPASILKESAQLDTDCREYLLVEDKVMLEIKSVDQLTQDHQSKLTACLVLSGYEVGLLINFNIENLELGIKRVINSELYDL